MSERIRVTATLPSDFVEELRHMGGGNLSQGLLAMRVLVQRLAPAQTVTNDFVVPSAASRAASKAAYMHTDDPEVAAALADYADFRLTRSEPTKTHVTHPDIADGSDWG